jgi:hypothetical protein
VLQAQVIEYVPHILVKCVLCQPTTNGKRRKWTTKIQEYDMVIKISTLIKGYNLTMLMEEINIYVKGINALEYCWRMFWKNKGIPI